MFPKYEEFMFWDFGRVFFAKLINLAWGTWRTDEYGVEIGMARERYPTKFDADTEMIRR